ncbi:hypothetical protein OAO01_00430 [Oligoflexia bacterium]|nr:hypothetical protein [Oligoflexia bacterium]
MRIILIICLTLFLIGVDCHTTESAFIQSAAAEQGQVLMAKKKRNPRRGNWNRYIRGKEASSANIIDVKAYDLGSLDGEPTSALDVRQQICHVDQDTGEETKEPFYDTMLRFDVRNDYSGVVRFKRFFYSLKNADGEGRSFKSRKMSLLGGIWAPGYGEVTSINVLFLDVQGDTKVFTGSSNPIPPDLGFRNVTLHLAGKDPNGRTIVVSVKAALSIKDVDRCD